MDERGRRSIARRVALLVAAGVVVSLALAGVAAAVSLGHLNRQLLGERRALAASVAGNVERLIRRHLATLSSLGAGSADPSGAGSAAPRSALRAAYLRSHDLSGVFLLTSDGELSAEEPPGLMMGVTLPTAELAAARRGDRPTVTDVRRVGRARRLESIIALSLVGIPCGSRDCQ